MGCPQQLSADGVELLLAMSYKCESYFINNVM